MATSVMSASPAMEQLIPPICKPIPIVGSSGHVAEVNEINDNPGYSHSTAAEIEFAASTPAGIVWLDHNYALPQSGGENKFLKPITKPCDVRQDDNKATKIKKGDKEKHEKAPKIKKEKEDNDSKSSKSEEPYRTGSGRTNYIFHIKPELPLQSTFSSNQHIFLSNIKSSVFPMSPTMSKLEHLLKSPSRSPSSRRSPSSFLSPSLNYHRCKKSGSLLSVAAYGKCADKDTDVDVDVESVEPDPVVQYDCNRAKNLMKECEKNVNFLRQTDVSDDWEDQIVRTGWTVSQRNIFEKVVGALHQERLARLVNTNNSGEPVLRRLSIDIAAQRFRKILGQYKWDPRLTQWLHGVLVDNLSFDYLSAYLDILQTLRVKFPDLVDKMIILTTGPLTEPLPISPLLLSNPENTDDVHLGGAPNLNSIKENIKKNLNAEAISLVLKRKWDPYSSTIQHSKMKKVPSYPIFVVIATNPVRSHTASNKRKKQFISLLAARGKVVSVTLNMSAHVCIRLRYYIGKLYRVAAERIRELKRQFPDRPVFSVGWGSGAILACRLSAIEPVAGVITLGFRLRGFMRKGSLSMTILQLTCPSLFVIGGLTNSTSIIDMEILRNGMRCVGSLLVVGGSNDELCIKNDYKKRLLVTQSFVDKTIVDELVKFISTCPVPVPSAEEKAMSLAMKSKRKSVSPSSSVYSSTGFSSPECGQAEVKIEDTSDRVNDMSRSFDNEMMDVTEFDFDGPKMIPSNTSSNKRKAYYRPAPSVSTSEKSLTSPTCITASQLVQQKPGVKRFSKPSGPNIPIKQRIQRPAPNPQSTPTSGMQSDHLQMQLQSPMIPAGANVEQETRPSINNSLVFNLLSAAPTQMLRIQREQESIISPEVLPAPTRFLFAVEESTPTSSALMLDAGMESYLPQPIVLPIPNKSITKDEYEHSGFKPQDTATAEPSHIRQSSKIISNSSPIITAPTILPGGATATPYLRTTVPISSAPSQQQFTTSHLFRLLTPSSSHESTKRRQSLSEIPMPTRVTEDLLATVSSSPVHHRKSDVDVFPNEVPEPKPSVESTIDKHAPQSQIQASANASKTAVATTIGSVPVAKLPKCDHSGSVPLSAVDVPIGVSKGGNPTESKLEAESLPKPSKGISTSLKKPAEPREDIANLRIKHSSNANSRTSEKEDTEVTAISENIVTSMNVTVRESKISTSTKTSSVGDAKDFVVEKGKSEVKAMTTDIQKSLQSNELPTTTTNSKTSIDCPNKSNIVMETLLKTKSENSEAEANPAIDVGEPTITIRENKHDSSKKLDEKDTDSCESSKVEILKEDAVPQKRKDSENALKQVVNPIVKDKEKVDVSSKRSQRPVKEVKDIKSGSINNRKSVPTMAGSKAKSTTESAESKTNVKSPMESNDRKTSKSTVETTDRKTRNELRSLESKKADTEQHSDTAKCSNQSTTRKRTISELSESNKSSNSDKKVERERLRSADKDKLGKPIPSDEKGTKRIRATPKVLKQTMEEPTSKKEEPPKKLTRSSCGPMYGSISEKLKETSQSPVNVSMKSATAAALKASKVCKKDVQKSSLSCSSKAPATISETQASRTRKRSENSASTQISKSNPHTLRKKSRLAYKEESESSDSTIEIVDELGSKRTSPTPKKLISKSSPKKKEVVYPSSTSSEESEQGVEENDEKEVAPRVTRSMRRQSVPGDAFGNESCQTSDVREHENEKLEVKETEADNEHSSTDTVKEDEKDKNDKRERKSSGSVGNCSGDDEDLETRKRTKPIHPVTPASLSVTRTRKISIPNYFAYGM